MNLLDAFILGSIQGITEFLPVSSSGHLVVAESLLGLHVESLKSFDVVVHVGTLVAIFAYFWRDFRDFFTALYKPKSKDPSVALHRTWIGYIILGSIPAVVVGLTLEDQIDTLFRDPAMVAWAFIIMAIVFYLSEKKHASTKPEKITLKSAIIIGCAQAAALIPGISRSGSTISAAITQGVAREKAARFSFLLGSPAIFGAGLLTFMKSDFNAIAPSILIMGFVSSAIVGYASVAFLMKFLKKHTLTTFSYYLLAIGVILLISA